MSLGAFLRLGWIGRVRIVAYSRILAFVSLISVYPHFLSALGPDGSDFLAFWSAGKMTLAGEAAQAYDRFQLAHVQAAVGRTDVFAFVNPPPFLLAIWPLGFLDYPTAWIVWTIVTYLAWLVTTRRLYPRLAWPIAAYPGALVAAWHAQTGFVTSALQAGAAAWLREKPLRAGLCIGALIVKPQLAVLFPVALLAGRHWRAIAGAAIGVIGLMLAAWAVFGTATILAYPQSFEVSTILLSTSGDAFFLRQVTVYSQLRLFAPDLVAWGVQALVSAGMIVLVWRAWSARGAADGALDGKLALLFAATPLATPYLFAYDLPFLAIPTCWLIARRGPGVQGWWRPVLLFFYLAPLVVRAMALPVGINPMPLVSAAMVWLIWRELRAPSGRNALTEGHVHPV